MSSSNPSIFFTAPGVVEIVDQQVPEPKPGEVLILREKDVDLDGYGIDAASRSRPAGFGVGWDHSIPAARRLQPCRRGRGRRRGSRLTVDGNAR